MALQQFLPGSVPSRTKSRLSRNLRKLVAAMQDYNHDRLRLIYSCLEDKAKKVEHQGDRQEIPMNANEQVKYNDEHRALLKETVDVEIHPIELIDSDEGQTPTDDHFFVDRAKIREEFKRDIDPAIEASLIDIVLIPQE